MIVKPHYFKGLEWERTKFWLESGKKDRILTVVSGGFDPIHSGHIRMISEASKLGDLLIVVINGDGFLQRKKKYNFMEEGERAYIANAIQGVDYVTIWDDGTQFVHGALELIKPNIFANGGDRGNDDQIPKEETAVCDRWGIKRVYGVGGNVKMNSSSELVENMQNLKENK